jgi:RNA polymerase sigma factor (sigma-70 family)
MTDYQIKVTVRNNIILQYIENMGFPSISSFATEYNLSATCVRSLINFADSPLTSSGEFRSLVYKLAEIFQVNPENLFTEKQLSLLKKNIKSIFVVSEENMQSKLNAVNSIEKLEHQRENEQNKTKLLEAIDKSLTPREILIIKSRFGLEGETLTLEDISKLIGVNRERVRQLEAKALRKLRNPHTCRKKDFNI